LRPSPNDPKALNEIAWDYLALPANERPLQEALTMAREAVKLAPDDAEALSTLGFAEVRNGMWNDAIQTLQKSVPLDGGASPFDFLFLAQAYHGRGDEALAGQNYGRAMKIIQEQGTADWVTVTLWRETAAALGKPAPTLPPANRPATQ
jgi:tetratricopeptide (TPR) repeat protein